MEESMRSHGIANDRANRVEALFEPVLKMWTWTGPGLFFVAV